MRARWMPPVLLTISMLALAGCDDAPVDAADAGGRETDAGAPTDGGSVVGDDAATTDDAAIAADSGSVIAGSDGCGAPLTIATGEWVARSVDVGGVARDFWVWLPDGYDPARAYPVVYQFHGCSGSATREDNNVPVQRESGADAIHVRGRAAARCWEGATDGPDVPYFDALVPAVEGAWCADPARRFATGYSSGGFMVHRLACIRGDVLRAVASIAGGQRGGSGCTGDVAALLIHDVDDGTVAISASEQTRDDRAMRNGCDVDAARTAIDPAPCEAYAGCDPRLPVVWCQTEGENHSRQDALAAEAFWTFLSSLPR